MMYFLLFILNFGASAQLQNQSYIGKWELLEYRDPKTNEITDEGDGIIMDIYNNGQIAITDVDGETENAILVSEGNKYFLIVDEDDKEEIIIRIEGDKMYWQYDGDILVFKRMK